MTLQARVRGKGGRATAAAARTAAQEAEAEREAERERAKESKRKAVNDRLRAQKEHMEWLSTSNRSRRASMRSSAAAGAATVKRERSSVSSNKAALRVPPRLNNLAAGERDIGGGSSLTPSDDPARQLQLAVARWGPTLPPPPTQAARANAAARAARAYSAHLGRVAEPPEPPTITRHAQPPPPHHPQQHPYQPPPPLLPPQPVIMPPTSPDAKPTLFGGVSGWLRSLLPGHDTNVTMVSPTRGPLSAAEQAYAASMHAQAYAAAGATANDQRSGLFDRSMSASGGKAASKRGRVMEAWAADAAARQTASSRRAPSPPPTRPHPFTTTAFNAKVLATRQLQQANASAKENNNHTETPMHPTDIKPPAAKVLKLTTAFGARVLATRHLQEAKAASKDAAPGQQPTGETPMRAIDKDGVIWHWTDEFGWRMLGDGEEEAAPKKVAKPKRTPAEIAMAAEARRRIMGVAPSPSRARAEYGWPEHAVALSAAARSTSPAPPERPPPPGTREWDGPATREAWAENAVVPYEDAADNARRELQFTTSQRPGSAAGRSTPPTRPDSPAQQVGGGLKLSKREAAEAAARLYSGGGRKGVNALKERETLRRVEGTVKTLVDATRLKPCDTELIARTIGRADHAMLRVISALFLRETGEALGAALLKLGDSDAKTVLCGVVEGVELWSDELPADEPLATEQAEFLYNSAVDEATLSAAAVHVFATASDEQVLAIKAAYRTKYRGTVDNLLAQTLIGPIHYQLRDLLLARCGVIRNRPAAAAALAEVMSGLVSGDNNGDAAAADGGESGAATATAAGASPTATPLPPGYSESDTIDIGMSCTNNMSSLRTNRNSAPSMMVLQQPDGEAIRIPGGYGGGVASGVAASEPHSSPQFRDRLRERTPHYSPDKMNLAAATHQRSSTTAGRAANILPNDVGWSAVEETKQSEAEIRRERWAAEQKKLAQDMEALLQQHQPGRSSSHVASSNAVRARVYSEAERAAAALRIQTCARRRAAMQERWQTWQAVLRIQAAARRWCVRREEYGRANKLGPPRHHPMTRLVVPAKQYFTMGRTGAPKGGRTAKGARQRPAAVKPREAVDSELQEELNKSRSRQVKSILSYDR